MCQHRDPEDAHEFLRELFSEAPRLNALAQGLDTPILRCSVCGSERLAFPEDFTQLGLALRHENHGRVASVQTALDIFLEPEIMTADFRWFVTMQLAQVHGKDQLMNTTLQQNQTFCVSNSNGGVTTLPQER